MKSWVDSMTIRGILITLVATILDRFGMAGMGIVPEEAVDTVINLVITALQFGGLIIAAIGRKRASAPLGGVL